MSNAGQQQQLLPKAASASKPPATAQEPIKSVTFEGLIPLASKEFFEAIFPAQPPSFHPGIHSEVIGLRLFHLQRMCGYYNSFVNIGSGCGGSRSYISYPSSDSDPETPRDSSTDGQQSGTDEETDKSNEAAH